jgi:oxalate decarboxylase/phosphoglucose isomerase-like protein (cupin superfamily)
MTNNERANAPAGPRSRYLAASEQFPRASKVQGSTVTVFVDERLAGADIYGGIITFAPGAELPLHWHPIGELQFLLAGEGLLLDAEATRRRSQGRQRLQSAGARRCPRFP